MKDSSVLPKRKASTEPDVLASFTACSQLNPVVATLSGKPSPYSSLEDDAIKKSRNVIKYIRRENFNFDYVCLTIYSPIYFL